MDIKAGTDVFFVLMGASVLIAALAGGFAVYGLLKAVVGVRLSEEEEFRGADLSIHRIGANPEEEARA